MDRRLHIARNGTGAVAVTRPGNTVDTQVVPQVGKIHSIGRISCRLTHLASSTVRDNTVLIRLLTPLKEPNKLADPRLVDLKRDKHWGRIEQIGMEVRKGRSNMGAEGQAE